MEPAIQFKDKLSPVAYQLLTALIHDYKSDLSPSERVYNKQDNSTLIHNLLISKKYRFSFKTYNEIFNILTDQI